MHKVKWLKRPLVRFFFLTWQAIKFVDPHGDPIAAFFGDLWRPPFCGRSEFARLDSACLNGDVRT